MNKKICKIFFLAVVLTPVLFLIAAAEKAASPVSTNQQSINTMQVPPFWKVRLADIEATVRSVKQGEVSIIARSPLGTPVYAVSYGTPNTSPATTNFSGGQGAGDTSCYKDEKAAPQSVFLVGGCHGSEAEATAGLLNFIQMLETGKDFRGETDEPLLSLAKKYRLIIIPSLNPDGRERSPDSLNAVNAVDARNFCQGTWKDGTPIGYPACKRYQPLAPAAVASLGGYPNSEGYNLMHDATVGDIKTAEVAGLLKKVVAERADLVLHLHSHQTPSEILPPNHGMMDVQRQQILAYRKRLGEFFTARNIPVRIARDPDPGNTWLCPLNLATLTSLATGALSPVFEQPDGSGKDKPDDFSEMVRTTYALVEMFLFHGQEEPFANRRRQMLNFLDSAAPLKGYEKD